MVVSRIYRGTSVAKKHYSSPMDFSSREYQCHLPTKSNYFLFLSTSATLSSVDMCDEAVSCSPSARNIGVMFDQSLCIVLHVNAVCQSSFFHLRNIGFIRKYLTYDAVKIIIHAFVISKLDYCNSLLYSLYHPILYESFNMFKTLPLALSTSVQDFAILLQS